MDAAIAPRASSRLAPAEAAKPQPPSPHELRQPPSLQIAGLPERLGYEPDRSHRDLLVRLGIRRPPAGGYEEEDDA